MTTLPAWAERCPTVFRFRLPIAVILGAAIGFAAHSWMWLNSTSHIVRYTGRVTINGQPLANAVVKFSPIPRPGESPLDVNPGSYAFTDSQGNFVLLQIENDQPGVTLGEHKVTFSTGKFVGDRFVDERVPYSWRKGLRTHYVSWPVRRQADFRIKTTVD